MYPRLLTFDERGQLPLIESDGHDHDESVDRGEFQSHMPRASRTPDVVGNNFYSLTAASIRAL